MRGQQDLDADAHDDGLEQEEAEEVDVVCFRYSAIVLAGFIPGHPVGRHRSLYGVDRDVQEQKGLGHRLDVGLPELERVEAFVVQADLVSPRRLHEVLLLVLPVEGGIPADGHRREQ